MLKHSRLSYLAGKSKTGSQRIRAATKLRSVLDRLGNEGRALCGNPEDWMTMERNCIDFVREKR